MDDKPSMPPVSLRTTETGTTLEERRRNVSSFWFWFCIIIAIFALIIGITTSLASVWLKNARPGTTQPSLPAPITTLPVQRTVPYAGLDFTIINAQYALYFVDDNIRPGPATVRLNVRVVNHSEGQSKVSYYDSIHLLIPNTAPIAPGNISLSAAGLQPGADETGWLDFAVPNNTVLDTLTLQLGSTAMSESLVELPMKKPFDASRYADKVYSQSSTFPYDWNGRILQYHLTSIEALYAYQGIQCKIGQQFYVFNFTIDNPNSTATTPGYGFDYLRLVLNSYSQPPIDNSLPANFQANATSITGYVVFTGSANMHNFTLGFLSPNSSTQQIFNVHVH